MVIIFRGIMCSMGKSLSYMNNLYMRLNIQHEAWLHSICNLILYDITIWQRRPSMGCASVTSAAVWEGECKSSILMN